MDRHKKTIKKNIIQARNGKYSAVWQHAAHTPYQL